MVVTVKLPFVPTVNVVAFALLIVGAVAGPVTLIRLLAVTACPSGLVTVTFFAPAVDPTVDTLIVTCVESV